jgi:hypothetical protein
MPSGPRDTFTVLGRRQWPDGMALEGMAFFRATDCDDGTMVVDAEDEDGGGVVFVIDDVRFAEMLRSMHECVFCGAGVLERAAAG